MSVNKNEPVVNVVNMNYNCDYQHFYLDDNNEICLDISDYYDFCEYLSKLQKLCENIILCKKITWNDSENKYVKCLSTVSFDWIKQTFNIDLCFGWWLEKIIKHLKWLEYIVYIDYDQYIKGFKFEREDGYHIILNHPVFDNDDYQIQDINYNDFTDVLYPRKVFRHNNNYSTYCYYINHCYWISYEIKSQYKDNKVVPIKGDNGHLLLDSTEKPFEDTNNYIENTSQAVFKQLYDLQQAMRNNVIMSQINAVTTKLDKFDSKHKSDCEHMRLDVESCADIIDRNTKQQKVYRDETNLLVTDLQDRISRLESLLCENVDSQIIDRILNINKESESLEQIVKKQQQTIDELQEELKKQREEFEEYKSQRQQQLAAIMSQM